jgi:hypothetical protein
MYAIFVKKSSWKTEKTFKFLNKLKMQFSLLINSAFMYDATIKNIRNRNGAFR